MRIQAQNSCAPIVYALNFNMVAFIDEHIKIMFLFKPGWKKKYFSPFKETSLTLGINFLDSSQVKQWQHFWDKHTLPRGTFWRTHLFTYGRPWILTEEEKAYFFFFFWKGIFLKVTPNTGNRKRWVGFMVRGHYSHFTQSFQNLITEPWPHQFF